MILGIAPGFACCYLLGSERARVAYRRFSSAPGPVRQVTERISGAIGGTQVPDEVKQAATRVTAVRQQLSRPRREQTKQSKRRVTGPRIRRRGFRGCRCAAGHRTTPGLHSLRTETSSISRMIDGCQATCRWVAGQVRNNALQVL